MSQSAAGHPIQPYNESKPTLGTPTVLDALGSMVGDQSDDSNSCPPEARNCTHCARVRANVFRYHQLSPWDCEELFHSPCPCDDAAPHATEDQRICAFCRHLRLRHLFLCPAERDPDSNYPSPPRLTYWKFVSLGRTRDVVRRAGGCPSCRFWAALATPLMPHFQDQLFGLSRRFNNPRFLEATVTPDGNDYNRVHMSVNIEDLPPTSVGSRASPDHYGSPPRRIDWRRTAAWLHECRQNHEECRPKEAGSLSPNFCVIDVQERTLVRPTLPCRYLALSYVWGSGLDRSKLTATRSNAKSLQEPGSLQPALLPRTIADAMVMCRELSERYLWADCLCIMQDDAEDKSEQIGMMASIYTAAQAVLVVASGSSMDQAIPGVSLDRPERHQSSFLGLRLIESTTKKPWELLVASAWLTRGWTYQEGILPSRKLYITDREIWFECGKVVFREDVYVDGWTGKYIKRGSELTWAPLSGWLGVLHAPGRDQSGDKPPWESYRQHLSRYTQRTLGDDCDIFNAFMGILNPLFSDHGGSTFGLPLANFDRALLWGTSRGENAEPPGLRRGAPTWSWGSMHGKIIAEGLDFIGTLVRWSQYSEADRDLVEVSIPERQWPDGPALGFIQNPMCLAIAWANGLFKGPCPWSLDHKAVSFHELNEVTTRLWTSPRDFPKDTLEKAELDQYASLDVRKAGILCGRVQTAVLKIVRWDCRNHDKVAASSPPSEGGRKGYIILDHQGDPVGIMKRLHTSTLESQIGPGVLDGGTDAEFLALSVATHDDPEDILLGEQAQRDSTSKCDRYEEIRDQEWSFLDCNGSALFPYPVVNVMLIWTDEEGYSYRIGIGVVMMTKWAEAKRAVRIVALK